MSFEYEFASNNSFQEESIGNMSLAPPMSEDSLRRLVAHQAATIEALTQQLTDLQARQTQSQGKLIKVFNKIASSVVERGSTPLPLLPGMNLYVFLARQLAGSTVQENYMKILARRKDIIFHAGHALYMLKFGWVAETRSELIEENPNGWYRCPGLLMRSPKLGWKTDNLGIAGKNMRFATDEVKKEWMYYIEEAEAIEMFTERFSYYVDYLTVAISMLSNFQLFALCVFYCTPAQRTSRSGSLSGNNSSVVSESSVLSVEDETPVLICNFGDVCTEMERKGIRRPNAQHCRNCRTPSGRPKSFRGPLTYLEHMRKFHKCPLKQPFVPSRTAAAATSDDEEDEVDLN
jgi:uncharacterized coiled-coil protein SlyX